MTDVQFSLNQPYRSWHLLCFQPCATTSRRQPHFVLEDTLRSVLYAPLSSFPSQGLLSFINLHVLTCHQYSYKWAAYPATKAIIKHQKYIPQHQQQYKAHSNHASHQPFQYSSNPKYSHPPTKPSAQNYTTKPHDNPPTTLPDSSYPHSQTFA
jgi:hypothetical protein